MNISITTIVIFILIGVFIQFATKFIFKLIGWVIVLLGGVYVLYHFGIGPFAKNPVNVIDLQTKYCVEEVDEDICDCVITPIRNDMNNRFSKEELTELEDKRGEALYVFQKSFSKVKPEVVACLAKRDAESKLDEFIKDLLPVNRGVIEGVESFTQWAKESAEETIDDWTSSKELIDKKYD